VAARLTAEELHKLEPRAGEYNIGNVWKNARKRALLDISNNTLQAYTARVGYKAAGNGISWAVLDTGVAWEHPHFAPGGQSTIAAMWNCSQNGKPQEVPQTHGKKFDGDGHGTHVAGIITGRSPDGKYSGVAPETKLHMYKVLNDRGEGDDSWIIKALDHIADLNSASPELKIHGVNLSLGGPFDASVYGCGFSPLCNELRRLWRQGVVVCIAAGNEGQVRVSTEDGFEDLNFSLSIGDPANLDEAIAVGSVHRERPHTYGVSYFSSRGPTADGRVKPDVVAPGEQIHSCNFRFRSGDEGTYYVPMSGTSMACPHVSGLLAAFLSARREFIGNPGKTKEILVKYCIDLARNPYHQGAGLPNLVKMLMET
jgi:subtilisin family serine protease